MYILIHFHKKLCAELLRKVKAFTNRTHKIFQGTGTTDKTGTVYPIPVLSITCGNRTKQIQFTQYQFCTRRNDLQNRARHYVFAYWVKAAAPQLGRTRTPAKAFTESTHATGDGQSRRRKRKDPAELHRLDGIREQNTGTRRTGRAHFQKNYTMKGAASQ